MSRVAFEGPLPGEPFAALGAFDLSASGYAGEEWLVSGRARRYRVPGDPGELPADGRVSARPADAADFRTRILVRRPSDPARFEGTLVVEWMNVSGGLDAAPDWMFLHRHLIRERAAWVGVSVQRAGIAGGGLVPGMPLKQADPERYASLEHPGDAFAYGIFSEIGRALRGAEGPLPGVERVIAVGESQSAAFLVTYANAVDPLECVFDAYLIHGRPAAGASLEGEFLRVVGGLNASRARISTAHRVREDVRVPVLTLQSETDVVTLGGARARQPDHERFRLWELAGAAHFDTYGLVASQLDDGRLPIGKLAEYMAPTDSPLGIRTRSLINSGPQQHYVGQAAIASLEEALRAGISPPEAPRLETTASGARIARDPLGIARGGIRTPWVEAPSAVLSGLGQSGGDFAFLFGTTHLLEEGALSRLYPGGPDEHRARFEAATEEAVAAGFLLEADAPEIRALGRHGRQPSGYSQASAVNDA